MGWGRGVDEDAGEPVSLVRAGGYGAGTGEPMKRFASLAMGLILIASVATPGCMTKGRLLNASLERMAMLRYENNVLRKERLANRRVKIKHGS